MFKSSKATPRISTLAALIFVAFFTESAHSANEWRSHFYQDRKFSSPGACNEFNIEIWHQVWPGHLDAIFTLSDIEEGYWAWTITNNAGGKLYCWIDKPDESGNEDSPPPEQPPENPPPDLPPDTPPEPPRPPENTPPPWEPANCTENPIVPAKAEKIRNELDWIDGGPSPLSFVRYYSSKTNTDLGIGKGWNHNWGASLSLYPASGPVGAIIKLPSGDEHVYSKLNGATSWTTANGLDQLTQNPNQTWTWKRANDDSLWIFSSTGLLISSTNRTGWTTTYTYSANGLLTGVTNPFGRQITLGYNAQNQLTSVQTPDGRILSYGYDTSRRLTSVTYPDNKQRQFVYEHTLFPNALTGIIDENNKRWGTFAYDAWGRAVSSELAGGVSRYEVGYPAARQSTIKDPLGITRSYSYSTAGGYSQVASSSAASGPGTSVIANRTINAQGLVTQSTDFKGNKSTTSWDLSRFLQTDYTEAFGTAQQRSTTYTWHSNLRLPVGITRTGRTTIFTYDTQGRPLSRTIVDTTVSPNTNRTSSWTYNAQGLVATATAANGAVTQYTYDSVGNVATMTNALGHVTTYSWDSGNRLASVTYPNGRVVSYTWDARDRLLTLASAGYTKTMTYLPSGQVHTVTDSAGYAVTYQYDDAHRMTGWSDNRSNSGVYTLDAMGNRTQEDLRNAQGQTAWRVARTINNLNRASSVTVGAQTTTFGYDANGDSTSVTNGQGQSESQNLDALRRVASITNAENATASLSYNALDATTQARDFKGVATTYTRDALGNATSETSPDTGTESAQYDALGLAATITDALGQTTSIERDRLGRPTLVTYADGRTTTLRYDLTPTSKGYLSEIVDASG
ncbi:DUF6531 domain-containing protein, partial [Acidovorax sp. sic0104]|uniref:DUF6531 domain-containing protein n=1 Tax=Acidovorax sp. sic0104 TaxID=2854784 RepID=UPI001C441B2A